MGHRRQHLQPAAAHERPRRARPDAEEDRAYREARRVVARKMSVAIHGVALASVLVLILFTTRSLRVTTIVALAWGIGFSIHYFVALVAPRLRGRWIREEVGRQVRQGVSDERRNIESRNVRSIGELSASIAHEIRNPISAAKSLVQQMGEDPVAPENIDYAKVALQELDRVERSISHLLRFARDEELELEPVSLAEVVGSALETFRDRVERQGVGLRSEVDAAGWVRGDAEKLRRVVINLAGNALDALEEAGTQEGRVEVLAGENLAGTEVWLRVRDNGPGIPPELRSRIFDPFHTTKEKGTGLGLALAKKVVEAHGGAIAVESAGSTGTEFVATFPALRRTAGGSAHGEERAR